MPNPVDRESFTLLNLTESGSDSVPDLDLVQPTRKPNKRKVKHRRRARSVKPSHNSQIASEFSPLKVCQCGSLLSPNRVGGAVLILGCLGSLFYLTFTLTGRIRYLENKLNSVDDASKSFPGSLLRINNCIEELQSNETELHTRLDSLDKRLHDLEAVVSGLSSKPKEKDVQQNLAEFGGKLSEVKQTVDLLRNKSKLNRSNMEKLTQELNELKLSSLNSTHVQSVDTDVVADLRSVLAKHNERISQSEEGLAKINRATTQLAKSSEAGKDLFNTRFTSLQGQISHLEDDNKNISSQLLSLDRTLNAAITQVKVSLTALTSQQQQQEEKWKKQQQQQLSQQQQQQQLSQQQQKQLQLQQRRQHASSQNENFKLIDTTHVKKGPRDRRSSAYPSTGGA